MHPLLGRFWEGWSLQDCENFRPQDDGLLSWSLVPETQSCRGKWSIWHLYAYTLQAVEVCRTHQKWQLSFHSTLYSFHSTLYSFLSTALNDIHNTIQNIKFYHECCEHAQSHRTAEEEISYSMTTDDIKMENSNAETDHVVKTKNTEPARESAFEDSISEEDVLQAFDRPFVWANCCTQTQQSILDEILEPSMTTLLMYLTNLLRQQPCLNNSISFRCGRVHFAPEKKMSSMNQKMMNRWATQSKKLMHHQQ